MTFLEVACTLLLASLFYTGVVFLVFKDVRRITRGKHED